MIWNREMYLAHMLGENVGRQMFTELFGPLIGLEEEWRAQGATDAECSLDAFGFDSVRYRFLGSYAGAISGLEETLLEENDAFRRTRDRLGREMLLSKKTATLPIPQSYPVETMDDWLKIKHWYEFSEARVPSMENLKACRKRQMEGELILMSLPGGYDEPRGLLGEENLSYAFYEDPEMIHDILDTIGSTVKQIVERVVEYVVPDVVHIHEDMAGRSGPMIGPNLVEEFLKPYYRGCWDPLQQAGAKIFSQDSDGHMMPVIDAFRDCGVTQFYPAEPAADMDMVLLKRKYGNTMQIKGGLDKHVLRRSKAEIRAELEYKICPETLQGGVIFGLDHRIPNGTPLENFWYYVNTARELLGLPPATQERWVRMAF